MFKAGELADLLARKDVLLRASAVHRAVLQVELGQVRPVVGWLDAGLGVARLIRDWGSAAAGLLSARRTAAAGPGGLLGRCLKWWSLAQSASALWRTFRTRD